MEWIFNERGCRGGEKPERVGDTANMSNFQLRRQQTIFSARNVVRRARSWVDLIMPVIESELGEIVNKEFTSIDDGYQSNLPFNTRLCPLLAVAYG